MGKSMMSYFESRGRFWDSATEVNYITAGYPS